MNSLVAISDLLDTAKASAFAGANYAVSERKRNRDVNSFDKNDVKLKLDVECQQKISEAIISRFPDHHIIGEEDTEARSASGNVYEWVIDPIDGTVNFFHNNPYWCSSVAVRLNQTTLAACVYAPDMGMCFEASADTQAFCNGRPVHVSDTDSLSLAMVHTSAGRSECTRSQPFRILNAICAAVQRPRICGAAALDVCLVAAGSADAYFEPGIYLWDIAAADLILNRAGGKGNIIHDFGRYRFAYLASNGRIHQKLSDIITPLITDY